MSYHNAFTDTIFIAPCTTMLSANLTEINSERQKKGMVYVFQVWQQSSFVYSFWWEVNGCLKELQTGTLYMYLWDRSDRYRKTETIISVDNMSIIVNKTLHFSGNPVSIYEISLRNEGHNHHLWSDSVYLLIYLHKPLVTVLLQPEC